jgi:hypothetical protein
MSMAILVLMDLSLIFRRTIESIAARQLKSLFLRPMHLVLPASVDPPQSSRMSSDPEREPPVV